MVVLTTDRSYFFPLKPRIKFKSLDGEDTYLTYDAHTTNTREFNLIYADMDNAIGETGTFNIIVEDSDNVIAKDHLHNTKVYIELGKTQAELSHFTIGFADIMDINRPRSKGYKEYRISGFGSVIQAQELLLLIRQAGKGDNDAEFTIRKLFERAQTDRKFRPLNRQDIESLTGWKRNISTDLTTNYKVLNEIFTTLWDYYDRLAALEGANWFIDVSTGEEVLTAMHPVKLHTGKVIKSGDLRSPSDQADKVSYIKDVFSITDDSSTAAGVYTRLYSTQVIEQELIKEQRLAKGGTKLNKRFIAQQVEIKNDQRRITDLAFQLSKVGEPESPKSRVNGFVIMDEEDKPKGTILGKFHIDLSQIEDQIEIIEVNDIDLKTRFLEGGSKIWLAFTDRSGIKGNVEDDPNNTVSWWHDNTVNTAHAAGTYSATAIAEENDRDSPNEADWKVSTTGPQYTFKIMSTIKRLLSRSNASAAKILRYKEAFIDSSFLKTPASLNRFLALNLNPMSKTRRTINSLLVTVPNNFLYRPYQYVTFSDGASGVAQDLQIARAAYIISALPGDPQYGTYQAEITLNGSYNPLIGSCTCE